MAFTFDETEVEARIEQLPTASRAAFAAACAERMALAYEKYSNRTGVGDPLLFKELRAKGEATEFLPSLDS